MPLNLFLMKLLVAIVVLSQLFNSVFISQPISSDTNAEKLSATYEPHVCLAKEAFLQLLNNSIAFTEAWELPVWVKVNPAKGKKLLIIPHQMQIQNRLSLRLDVTIGRERIY